MHYKEKLAIWFKILSSGDLSFSYPSSKLRPWPVMSFCMKFENWLESTLHYWERACILGIGEKNLKWKKCHKPSVPILLWYIRLHMYWFPNHIFVNCYQGWAFSLTNASLVNFHSDKMKLQPSALAWATVKKTQISATSYNNFNMILTF